MIYIDDLLLIGKDEDACKAAIAAAVDLFKELGAVVNVAKSQLFPSQRIEYLGFVIDSKSMQITVPQKKMENTRKTLRAALKKPASARSLASVLGKINSLQGAVLPCRVHTTGLHTLKLKLAASSWDKQAPLTEAKEDLLWWKANLHSLNGRI